MHLLALSGQRSAALGQYEACHKALAVVPNLEASIFFRKSLYFLLSEG
jgi:hypothetical protein